MNFIAFDDGYFPVEYKAGRGYTVIAGVKTSEVFKPVAIGAKPVPVDANQSTNAIVELSKKLGKGVILLDGITYSGFDIVDPWLVNKLTGSPVIVVQYGEIRVDRVERALRKHFRNGEERLGLFMRTYSSMKPLETKWRTIRILPVGIEYPAAVEYLRKAMIYSPIPEPLRIAHFIASALTRMFYHRMWSTGL
ncbi:DUF99 family protein [Thermogladius sp. 4427co]|uniref:endonuclease dU n=1 Tax=Thermogladius sp. 4427co TaxID=3450718 RepID=UPI003F7964A6